MFMMLVSIFNLIKKFMLNLILNVTLRGKSALLEGELLVPSFAGEFLTFTFKALELVILGLAE